ncbi:M20 family metallopeptidase [Rhodococcus sp. NPDC059968]|uniref:M20 family metallopeptidase n=1 Tax=Rhodococcus sp. NPDC059968 TaxID=3347017 RepID=UPI00366EF79B
MNSRESSPGSALPKEIIEFLRTDVRERSDDLLAVSHRIHAQPELRFAEHFASGLLGDILRREGFDTEAGIAGLRTAFVASYGSAENGPTVAIFLEYDALETIGHGCGHNVIASIGLGAALSVKRWMESSKLNVGRLLVIGSPGEEGGGGKNHLIDSGRLDDIDIAMMMHPEGENLSAMATLGRIALDFDFSGRAAHAAVSPEKGVNALDASVLTLNAIGLLRQQLPSDVRVHAIMTDGGEVPNIIPEHSSVRVYVRAPDSRYLIDELQPRIENCARGAALATGATLSISKQSPTYAAMAPNPVLAQLVEDGFAIVGRTTSPTRPDAFPGSTDMGNVSQIIPSIHPCIELVPGLGMHTREAATAARGPHGDSAVLDGAFVLAMTAVRVFLSPDLTARIKESFTEGVRVGI